MGLCASHASCWTILDSSVAVPVPHPPLNPCMASCKTTPRFNRPFTTAAHTFHVTSTSPIPQYHSLTFRMRTIVVHASYAGGSPYPNIRCTNLTKTSHRLLTGSFLRGDSRSHPFKSSACITNGPPALPPFSPFTSVSKYNSVGILYLMYDCCTKIGTLSTSGGLFW